MKQTIIQTKQKQAYDTEENWQTNNPVLLAGQLAYSSDKYGKYKVGDGVLHWNELEYANDDDTVKKLTDDYISEHTTIQDFIEGLETNTIYYYDSGDINTASPWFKLLSMEAVKSPGGYLRISTGNYGGGGTVSFLQQVNNALYIRSYSLLYNEWQGNWESILSSNSIVNNFTQETPGSPVDATQLNKNVEGSYAEYAENTYATKTELETEIDTLKNSVSDGKTAVANAITGKGITTATNATFQTMAANISKISTGADVSGVTANANDVAKGKVIVDKNGNAVTGAMPDRSHVAGGAPGVVGLNNSNYAGVAVSPFDAAIHWTENSDGVTRFCIRPPWGVYGGTSGTRGGDGYVGFPVDGFGNAAQNQVFSGATFTSKNGLKISGTMANNGAVSKTLGINGSYTIPAGYHNGSGKVTQSIATKAAATYAPGTTDQTIASGQYLSGTQTIKGDANLKAENIKSGVSIFGVTGTASSTSGIPEKWKVAIGNKYYTSTTQSSNSCTGQHIYFEGMANPILAVSWICNVQGMVMNTGLILPNSNTTATLSSSSTYWFRIIEWNGAIEAKSHWYKSYASYLVSNTGASFTLNNGVRFYIQLNSSYNCISVMNSTINSNLSAKISIIVYNM